MKTNFPSQFIRWLVLSLVILALLVGVQKATSEQYQRLVPITPGNVNQIRQVANFEQSTVCTTTFSPDGKLLASSGESAVALRDMANGKVINTLAPGHKWVRSIAFSPNGKLVAATSSETCGNTNVRVWEIATGKLRFQRLDDFEHMATSVAFSPDSTLVAVGTGCVFDVEGSAFIKVWDTAAGTLRRDIRVVSFVRDLAFSPDGTLLAAATADGIIRLFEVATGTIRTELRGPPSGVSSLAFSQDGTKLASGGAVARLWDMARGKLLYRFEAPVGEVVDVAFSADGRLVVTGGLSHTLLFWDSATGRVLAVRDVGAVDNYVNSVAFNADSTLLATCEHDQMLRLWGVQGQ